MWISKTIMDNYSYRQYNIDDGLSQLYFHYSADKTSLLHFFGR